MTTWRNRLPGEVTLSKPDALGIISAVRDGRIIGALAPKGNGWLAGFRVDDRIVYEDVEAPSRTAALARIVRHDLGLPGAIL